MNVTKLNESASLSLLILRWLAQIAGGFMYVQVAAAHYCAAARSVQKPERHIGIASLCY